MLAPRLVEHACNHVAVFRHGPVADRALPRMLRVCGITVGAPEDMGQVVRCLAPAPAASASGRCRLRGRRLRSRAGRPVRRCAVAPAKLGTAGEDHAVDALSPAQHRSAERAGFQHLKVVPRLLRPAVRELGEVGLAEFEQGIDQGPDNARHDDHDRELHTWLNSTEVSARPQQKAADPPGVTGRSQALPVSAERYLRPPGVTWRREALPAGPERCRARLGVACARRAAYTGPRMATLYVVATPIGNLSDITFRAIETLKSVDLIVCEDTRHSRRLLDHYGIRKPLRSGHSHNERESAERVVGHLKDGQDVAYITDAGTPGVSDPGRTLVRIVRDAGFAVVPIPGASALTALLSVAGTPGKTVIFEGFLSPKAGRRSRRLAELLETGEIFIIYESPHRLVKLLGALADLEPEREVLLGRELTKVHEELLEGSAKDVLETVAGRATVKGECVLLVGSPKKG